MMYRASSETATWQFFWYEKNLQGDVVAVYSHDGVKLVSYAYDAWGNTTTTYHSGGASTGARYNPIRYRGYYYDRDVGLYCLGTRWYSTQFRRFLSPDDISYLGANGDLNSYNLYAYCSNNPVMYVDPSGHAAISLLAVLIIGGLVSWGLSELFGEHLVTGTGLAITGGSAVYYGYDFSNSSWMDCWRNHCCSRYMYIDFCIGRITATFYWS